MVVVLGYDGCDCYIVDKVEALSGEMIKDTHVFNYENNLYWTIVLLFVEIASSFADLHFAQASWKCFMLV